MKNRFFIVLFLSCFSSSLMAQKFAYVDTEYILNNIPSYKTATQQLDEISKKWQAEVEKVFGEVELLYKKFQNEKVMLSEDMQKQREEEVINKEKEAKALQKKYFGKEGDLFKKRQELVKPIQDEIYNAVKELSQESEYAIIFDTAGGGNVMYTDPKYDLSDQVLKKMGHNK